MASEKTSGEKDVIQAGGEGGVTCVPTVPGICLGASQFVPKERGSVPPVLRLRHEELSCISLFIYFFFWGGGDALLICG